jgi:glycosidase
MLPGTSVTYYGEELGMTDRCAFFEDDNHETPAKICDPATTTFGSEWARSPMQWDDTKNAGFSTSDELFIPAADNYPTLNVKAQTGKANSHLEIHRSLLKLRKHKAIRESDKFDIKALGVNSFAFKR